MTPGQFKRLRVGSLVVCTDGALGRVTGIDPDEKIFDAKWNDNTDDICLDALSKSFWPYDPKVRGGIIPLATKSAADTA